MGVSTGIYSRSSEVLKKIQDLNAATKVTKVGYCRPLRLVASEIRPLVLSCPILAHTYRYRGVRKLYSPSFREGIFSEVANTYLEVPCSYASTANLLKRAKSVT